MIRASSLWLLIFSLIAFAQPVFAQEEDDSTATDAAIFHQQVTTGCIYEFKTNPKTASMPADIRDKFCDCIDGWLRSNNLNDEASAKANEPLMKQVATYCFAEAVGR